jgi:hypothetical protein
MPADYYIARQVGTQGVILPLFAGNITTGAGLTNIIASTVGFAWYRNDMAAASTGQCTSGALGNYSASSWVQVLSTGLRGWYNFGIPNSVFVSGSGAAIRLSTAAMEVNIFIELTKTDNQTYFSSQVLSSNQLVNVNLVRGSPAVTTEAGVQAVAWDLGRTANLTSTVALTGMSISTNILVNLNRVLGSTPVTTGPGTFSVGITGTQVYDITGNLSGSVGSVTGLNGALLDVSVSSRLATAGYTAPLTAAGTRTAIGLSTASLDSRIDTLATGAQADAIQAKTSSMTFTTSSALDVNVKHLNDVAITGDGSGTPFNV